MKRILLIVKVLFYNSLKKQIKRLFMNFNFSLQELDFENIGIWPKSVKIAAIFMVFFLVLFFGYQFDLRHKTQELNALKYEEKKLKNILEDKQHLASNFFSYQKQLQSVEQRFHDLLIQLPTQTEIPGLLEDISKSGIANGLEFKLFKPEPEKKNEFYAELPINISVEGTFHQIALFISQISSLERIVTLHDFDLQFRKNENQITNSEKALKSSNKLTLDIKAKTYRYLGSKPYDEKKV